MFSIGKSEPVSCGGHHLVRHAIVWLGGQRGETNLGLPEEHPICQVIGRLEERFDFRGSWIVCHRTDSMSPFQFKREKLRLGRAQWQIDTHDSCLRAYRSVSRQEPWPYASPRGLPHGASDLLLLGGTGFAGVDCIDLPSQRRAVPSEDLVLRPPVVEYLLETQQQVVCIGRTHTDSSPGISILGPAGLMPEGFVPADAIHAIHEGTEAGHAWSYPRLTDD